MLNKNMVLLYQSNTNKSQLLTKKNWNMYLIEKYKAWAEYPEQYTATQVLTEIISDLKNEIPPAPNCAMCKYQKVSKYMAPCYNCRNLNIYAKWAE